ncbi:MAG: ribosome recycling factor [Candidatus Zixiibacteriota bacterium]
MLDAMFKDLKEKMHKSVDTVVREFHVVRTGKASAHLLDTVRVETYGTMLPLNQVATINAPEPRLIVVQPFDKNTIGDIVKGIQKSDIGLNPSVDGGVIRVPVPALNEERRKELVKHCKHVAEEGRVAIRNVRRDANERVKRLLKDKEISEDQEKEAHEKVQKITDENIHEIDQQLVKKEKEVMEV